MKLSTSLVAVKKITSTYDRSSFAHDELEQAAKLILAAEGVVNPIVLQRTSLESYEVVDGDFEYYAAVRAREIDPRKGEMIGAFILESEKEDFIKEQIKIFRRKTQEDNNQSIENLSKEDRDKDFIYKEVKRIAENIGKIDELDSKQTKIQNNVESINKNIEQLFEAVSRVENLLNERSISPAQFPTNRNSMTVDQLKAEAKAKNIEKYSRMRKAELIATLSKADK